MPERQQFRELMSPWFDLEPEVHLHHHDGTDLRIDFIGIPKFEFSVPFIGFEVNSGEFGHFNDFAVVLRQAVDYMHCRIEDNRPSLNPFYEKPISYCFVWWPGIHRKIIDGVDVDNNTVLVRKAIGREYRYSAPQLALMQAGAIRLASHFNVGFVVHNHSSSTGQEFHELNIGGAPLWDSVQGVRPMARQIRPRRGRGSRR